MGDLAGPELGFKALLLTSEALTWVQGNWWQPPGVCCPIPERSEEVRDDDGEVVAPEPGVFITLECSGVCLPIAERILFPFIPVDGENAFKQELSKQEGRRITAHKVLQTYSTKKHDKYTVTGSRRNRLSIGVIHNKMTEGGNSELQPEDPCPIKMTSL